MAEIVYEFKEIVRLKEMLEKEGIEHEYLERYRGYPVELYQIKIYNPIDTRKILVSVIQGHLSLGGLEDKLEIGDFSFHRNDIYEGCLSAEDALKRIKLALKCVNKEKDNFDMGE